VIWRRQEIPHITHSDGRNSPHPTVMYPIFTVLITLPVAGDAMGSFVAPVFVRSSRLRSPEPHPATCEPKARAKPVHRPCNYVPALASFHPAVSRPNHSDILLHGRFGITPLRPALCMWSPTGGVHLVFRLAQLLAFFLSTAHCVRCTGPRAHQHFTHQQSKCVLVKIC
jgi:hypothetical protein